MCVLIPNFSHEADFFLFLYSYLFKYTATSNTIYYLVRNEQKEFKATCNFSSTTPEVSSLMQRTFLLHFPPASPSLSFTNRKLLPLKLRCSLNKSFVNVLLLMGTQPSHQRKRERVGREYLGNQRSNTKWAGDD